MRALRLSDPNSMIFWRVINGLTFVFTVGLLPLTLSAQEHFVSFEGSELRPGSGDKAAAELIFVIRQGYHIQSDDPSNPAFIPTKLSWTMIPESVSIERVIFPAPEPFFIGTEKSDVFSDTLRVIVEFTGPDKPVISEGELYYQACDKTKCFFPRKLPFSFNYIPDRKK